jgi:hypothetical protein
MKPWTLALIIGGAAVGGLLIWKSRATAEPPALVPVPVIYHRGDIYDSGVPGTRYITIIEAYVSANNVQHVKTRWGIYPDLEMGECDIHDILPGEQARDYSWLWSFLRHVELPDTLLC